MGGVCVCVSDPGRALGSSDGVSPSSVGISDWVGVIYVREGWAGGVWWFLGSVCAGVCGS